MTHLHSDDLDVYALSDEQISTILSDALAQILSSQDLSYHTMRQVMLIIMHGKCPDALMGAILAGLRLKKESIDEITAAASVMIDLADKITLPSTCANAVDIVGTGGDGSNLFNVSTASTFVAAAAGVVVAKHGNRGVSSKSGSSDLLEQAGIRLDLTKEQTLECIDKHGIGFLFAPNHHPAIRHAMPVRRQLKTRTIFNVLGPLTNPARVTRCVVGVFDHRLCRPLAQVLQNLGAKHALVISSCDGLDEFSLAADTMVSELKDGIISDYQISPEQLGITKQSLAGLSVSSSAQSLEIIKNALTNQNVSKDIAKAQDMIAINAGAAIYVAGMADTHKQGVQIAKEIIEQGLAWHKLEQFSQFTHQIANNP